MGHSSVQNQSFIEIQEMNILELSDSVIDGVIGLGFASKVNETLIPFITNFFWQTSIKPLFSIYINRYVGKV